MLWSKHTEWKIGLKKTKKRQYAAYKRLHGERNRKWGNGERYFMQMEMTRKGG